MRRIRWTRTIIFDGPEDWVLKCMSRSWNCGARIVYSRDEGINSFRIGTDKTAECTEYKVETYETEDVAK